MLKQLALLGFLSILAVGMVACAPPPEPVAEEEPPPPPPPPPPVFELTEVDLIAEEPEFTSRNISVLGVEVGAVTNDIETLGDIDNTRNDIDDYIIAYQGGGVVLYSFKLTGQARRIEVTSLFGEDIVSQPLQDWLDDGDVDQMRELMGPEDTVEELPDSDATEYSYDARGIRFIQYDLSGTEINAIRFSEFFD